MSASFPLLGRILQLEISIKININEAQKLDIISKYFVPYDLHFNKEGNKLVADEFIKQYFNISE